MIGVPRIDGKTTPRDIPLFPPFAHLLWEWSTGKPLVAKTGEQWPATGQSIEPNMLQFPGYCADEQKRCWDKSISALAYVGTHHEAARILTQGKTAASAFGVNHAFQDSPLHKLGTHSMKKSAVMVFVLSFTYR